MSQANDTRPLSELLSGLVSDISGLFRKEIQLARAETSEKVGEMMGGMVSLLIGGVLMLGALGVLLSALVTIIAAFFVAAARKQQLVPGKLQFAGEMAYGFVRNSIAKDIIGGKDFIKYVPLLFSLFFFILVNNIYGAIPVIQLPSFSHVGGAYVLAGIVYFTWIIIGIKKNGLKYFKLATVPSGVPWYILPIVVPIEIISNFLVRPVTHSLRLFATMLAGFS